MHEHLTTVVYTRRLRDWFCKRYWTRCWDCDLREGPYKQDPRHA
jgi:hypothetical protein